MLELSVIAGGEPGRVWRIAPGSTVRVGSTSVAEVVLTGDEHVGATHCALYWVGDECRVRDLGAGGTWLNGRGVQDELVRSGDVVQCGATQLRIDHAAIAASTEAEAEGDPKAKALATLRALPGRLYAVLDAAADPEVLQLLRRSGYRYECLYSGWAANVYGEVAPYLVQLRKKGRLLEQLVENGWGKGWGIFGSTTMEFRSVMRVLRSLEKMQSSAPMIVRFYDPKIFAGQFDQQSILRTSTRTDIGIDWFAE